MEHKKGGRPSRATHLARLQLVRDFVLSSPRPTTPSEVARELKISRGAAQHAMVKLSFHDEILLWLTPEGVVLAWKPLKEMR